VTTSARNPRSASAAEASAYLNLTPKRFHELVAAGVITKAGGRGYDLDRALWEYLSHHHARIARLPAPVADFLLRLPEQLAPVMVGCRDRGEATARLRQAVGEFLADAAARTN
jgi:hypothetical protein